MTFGPQNPQEVEAFKVEGLRVDVQYGLQTLLNRKKMSHKEFAELVGIANVFSDDCDLTIRQLAHIAHKLEVPCLISFGGAHE